MSTLVLALIDLAVQLGRWILERLAKRGFSKLIGYMDGKIDDFARRLARARTNRRKRWLRGRIDRWTRAMAWLEANSSKAAKRTIDEVCKLPEVQRLPLKSACEVRP
jgi:hypothetical protein